MALKLRRQGLTFTNAILPLMTGAVIFRRVLGGAQTELGSLQLSMGTEGQAAQHNSQEDQEGRNLRLARPNPSRAGAAECEGTSQEKTQDRRTDEGISFGLGGHKS